MLEFEFEFLVLVRVSHSSLNQCQFTSVVEICFGGIFFGGGGIGGKLRSVAVSLSTLI